MHSDDVGASLALPTAALISSFITNYAHTYQVVHTAQGSGQESEEAGEE